MLSPDDIPDIRKLNTTAKQCIAHNDPTQAMLCLERSLFLHQHYLGLESNEVWALAHRMCTFAIESARYFLNLNSWDDARKFIAKAEALVTKNDYNLRISINNLLATYYRRIGKLRVAYTYLQRAMKIDQISKLDTLQAAETRLNACAILSQLGQHDKALQIAQKALILLQERVMKHEDKLDVSYYSVQAVAYHNIAVEEEFLKKPPAQIMQSYRRAAQIAKDHCENELATALNQSLNSAEAMWAQKKNHVVFSKARESKATHCVKAVSKKSSIPKRTTQPYGIDTSTSVVEDALSPKGSGIDMSQFDNRALADSFELPVPISQPIASAPNDELIALITPRLDNNEAIDIATKDSIDIQDKAFLNDDNTVEVDNEDESKSISMDEVKDNAIFENEEKAYLNDGDTSDMVNEVDNEDQLNSNITDEAKEYDDTPTESKTVYSEEK
ncbi:hypothetical protein THRCLA_20711 [Thraustotheca clavata]|uniref:Uncharacterized protein n=1 Tax=Thraustotheca clavata TaxID=74557 RepID=A0A1W0A4C0_9STRA|nr:hypothetical protein THRCLA_20711 [Thraustotheca clavata]